MLVQLPSGKLSFKILNRMAYLYVVFPMCPCTHYWKDSIKHTPPWKLTTLYFTSLSLVAQCFIHLLLRSKSLALGIVNFYYFNLCLGQWRQGIRWSPLCHCLGLGLVGSLEAGPSSLEMMAQLQCLPYYSLYFNFCYVGDSTQTDYSNISVT